MLPSQIRKLTEFAIFGLVSLGSCVRIDTSQPILHSPEAVLHQALKVAARHERNGQRPLLPPPHVIKKNAVGQQETAAVQLVKLKCV